MIRALHPVVETAPLRDVAPFEFGRIMKSLEMAVVVWDAIRGIAYLLSRPGVDPQRRVNRTSWSSNNERRSDHRAVPCRDPT